MVSVFAQNLIPYIELMMATSAYPLLLSVKMGLCRAPISHRCARRYPVARMFPGIATVLQTLT